MRLLTATGCRSWSDFAACATGWTEEGVQDQYEYITLREQP